MVTISAGLVFAASNIFLEKQIGESCEMKDQPTTVLVVDDERIIADALAALLGQDGYSASAVYDGDSALERIRTGIPDVVIVDVTMPGMSGIELAITIRDSWPSCKVLLVSGNTAPEDVLADMHKRGYEFTLLSKPGLLGELHRFFTDFHSEVLPRTLAPV